jgi:hypothetical protein
MSVPTKQQSGKAQQQQLLEQPPPSQPPAEKEADLIDAILAQTADRIGRTARRYCTELEATDDHMRKAVLMAKGIEYLRRELTGPMMQTIMGLMNSPLGFMTDHVPTAYKEENRVPYSVEIVRDCAIQAMLHGVFFVGNEFNILAGRCYITQNGWRRKVEEISGLTDFDIAPGIPVVSAAHQGQTVVRVSATWRHNGIPGMLVGSDGKPGRVFPIIVAGKYSTPDQTIGKAKAKAYRAAYEKITGSTHTISEEPGDLTPPESAATPPTRTTALETKLADQAAAMKTGVKENVLVELRKLSQQVREGDFRALLARYETDDLGKLTPPQSELLLAELGELVKADAAAEHA